MLMSKEEPKEHVEERNPADQLIPTKLFSNSPPWKIDDPFNARVASLFMSEFGSDGVIFAGEHKTRIPIHRLIVDTGSPVLANLFEISDSKDSIILTDVDLDSFKVLLKHLYGDLRAPFTNVVELLELSSRFKVKDTLDVCLERLSHEDVGGVLVLRLLDVALSLNNEYLINQSLACVCKNAWVLLELNEFLLASPQLVNIVLQQDKLEVMSELQVFKSLMRWGEARVAMGLCTSRSTEECVEPFLRYIRFPLMSVMEFIEHVVTTTLLDVEDRSGIVTTITRINKELIRMPERNAINENLNGTRFSVKPRLYYAPDCPLELDGETLGISSSECTLGVAKTPGATLLPPDVPRVTSFTVESPLEGKFHFRVEQISELTVGVCVYSPPLVINNTPWQIVLEKHEGLDFSKVLRPDFDGRTIMFLGAYLVCLQPTATELEWAFPVDGVFKLRPQQKTQSSKNYYKRIRHVYRPMSTKAGFSRFLSWTELLNPANQFVVNDSILFEADVTLGAAIIRSKFN